MLNFGVQKRRYLLSVPLLLSAIILAALLKNPAITTSRFHPAPQAASNPLMGWAVDARWEPGQSPVDHSLVYATLTWKDFEPRQGEYDFASFEAENHLDQWWAMGKQLVLRFVMDVPGDQPHRDIPDYLYEAMGQDSGTPYAGPLGMGFSPNYLHPYLEERHYLAIEALGQRYDGHPGVACVELGSLGHDGSWQTGDVLSEWDLPPASQVVTWAWHYQNAFPRTPLLMSAPYQPARVAGMGLYNNSLGDPEKTWDWLDVVHYGGYDDKIGCELRPMTHALNTSLSGGRIARDADQEALLGTEYQQLLKQISASNVTYVSGLDPEAARAYPRVLSTAQSLMGYHLWVREASYPSAIRAGYCLRVSLDLYNDGCQPPLMDWPLELSLLRDGEPAFRQIIHMDLTRLTPGVHSLFLDMDLDRDLLGEYQLALAILNPHTLEPGVSFEMETRQYGQRYVLGSVEILPG